jgi:hypothetical protein
MISPVCVQDPPLNLDAGAYYLHHVSGLHTDGVCVSSEDIHRSIGVTQLQSLAVSCEKEI